MNNGYNFTSKPCQRCGCFIFGDARFCPVCGASQKKPRSPAAAFALAMLKCLGYYAVFSGVNGIVLFIYSTLVSYTGFYSEGGRVLFDSEAFSRLYMTYIHEISVLAGILVLLAYYLIFRLRGKSFAKKISLKKISPGAAGAMAVYGVGFQIIISIGLSILYFLLPDLSSYSNSDSVNALFSAGSPVAQFLNVAVITGIVEEVVFRGLIYSEMKAHLPRKLAIIASAVVFGIAHMNLEQFFYTSLLGVFLAVFYDRCGTIVAPMLVHIAFNGSNFLLAYLNFEHDMPYIAIFIAAIGICIVTTAFLFFTQKESVKKTATDK